MTNNISYNDFNHFVNLRGKRPYLHIKVKDWVLVLSVTSREKICFPHKFKLELDCSCLDSEKYENSFANLNTKILIPWQKFPIIAKKYGIDFRSFHSCLSPVQLKELLLAVEKYWSGGKRKLITVVLNN